MPRDIDIAPLYPYKRKICEIKVARYAVNQAFRRIDLPYGARGIEDGPLVLEFRSDKVVFLLKPLGDHFTLHAGNNSGVLDIHRTWTDERGVVRHQTIFAIRRADVPALLGELSTSVRQLFKLIRRLRIGWLARHGIGVVRGLEFTTNDDLSLVTSKKQRNRIVVEQAKVLRNLIVPKYLDDIWSFPDGPFSLFSGNRRIGVAYKVTDQFGWSRLFWVKLHDLIHFGNQVSPQFIKTALRYAIPPEKYGEYGVLAPNLTQQGA
jgi:hypothetical protein